MFPVLFSQQTSNVSLLSKWHCRYRWAVNRTANLDRNLCLKSFIWLSYSVRFDYFAVNRSFYSNWPLRWSTLTGQNYHVQPPLTYNWKDFDTFSWTNYPNFSHVVWRFSECMGFQINKLILWPPPARFDRFLHLTVEILDWLKEFMDIGQGLGGKLAVGSPV